MSILLAAETLLPPSIVIALLVVSVVALLLVRELGLFGERSEEVRRTLYATEPSMPLLVNLMMALGVFVLASFVIGIVVRGDVPADKMTDLPPDKLVLLNVVIPTAVFISLAAGLATFVPRGLERVGLNRSPLQAARFGAPLLLAVFPLLFLVLGVAEYLYQAIGYRHEEAHQLLTAMDPDKPLVKFGAILAAVVVAPLFEEFLFRGHLQPLIRRVFSLRVAPVPEPVQLPVAEAVGEQPADQAVPLTYANPMPPSFWPSLMAVVVSSLMFAVVHPLWSAPPIFVLSLALGFAYERTANLWVPIIMHALFNAVMTSLFLSQT